MKLCDVCRTKENVTVDRFVDINIIISGKKDPEFTIIRYNACDKCHKELVAKVIKVVKQITFKELYYEPST